MKKISILILLSLILMVSGYRGFKEYLLLRRGNSFSINQKYGEADQVYKETALKYRSSTAESNGVINLYRGKLYKELLDTKTGVNFYRGNTEVYLGDKEQDPSSQIEGYKRALEEYKAAMKTSDDINIRKNYEIILKKIEDLEEQQKKQEQENQNDQTKQDDQTNEDKQDDGDRDEQGNENQQDRGDNKDNQDGEDSDSHKKEQSDDESEEGQEDQQTHENKKEQNRPQSSEVSQKDEVPSTEKREALATLERLENSEEQAFRNNERLEYLGGDTDESW